MVDGSVGSRSKTGGKKKKKGKQKKNKKVTAEQAVALEYVREWVFGHGRPAPPQADDFDVLPNLPMAGEQPLLFEMHSHTIHSDGFLSPSALVERAHRKGVKVLALTDHDTMAGIPEALEAACKYGIRIIPGVEISTTFSSSRAGPKNEEPVHILAYYGSCGPAKSDELENCLSNIRDGRFLRAKEMLLKLKSLKMPIKWESLIKITGHGVAPGRLHVARAMVEAGYVENLKQGFSRYLYDGGPAYATGNEPAEEEAVKLICRTGGVATLAHPWALKNPLAIIKSLSGAGLHAMEVYRSDGKLAVFSDLADTFDLVKLGGSDYHARGGHDESDLGSVNLPILSIHEFLKRGRGIWCEAIKDIIQKFAEEPSDSTFEKIVKYARVKNLKVDMNLSCHKDIVELCLSSWLTNEEMQASDIEVLRAKLSHI